ncbi:MAG: LPXTG cell wall anchor domain-containing protein [Flavobacteriaceae bacterium]
MALDDLKYHFSALDEHLNAYLEDSVEYAKLKSFKLSMVLVTYVIKVLIIGIIAMLAFFVLSLAAASAMNEYLGNNHSGYLIVGLIYLVLGFLFYLFRKKMNKPILRGFSKHFFNNNDNEVL